MIQLGQTFRSGSDVGKAVYAEEGVFEAVSRKTGATLRIVCQPNASIASVVELGNDEWLVTKIAEAPIGGEPQDQRYQQHQARAKAAGQP